MKPKRSKGPQVRPSEFLSLVLRHELEKAGIELDDAGWIAVDELLAGCAHAGREISRERLEEIVETNDKKRFSFSEDGTRMRANQGHSIDDRRRARLRGVNSA